MKALRSADSSLIGLVSSLRLSPTFFSRTKCRTSHTSGGHWSSGVPNSSPIFINPNAPMSLMSPAEKTSTPGVLFTIIFTWPTICFRPNSSDLGGILFRLCLSTAPHSGFHSHLCTVMFLSHLSEICTTFSGYFLTHSLGAICLMISPLTTSFRSVSYTWCKVLNGLDFAS